MDPGEKTSSRYAGLAATLAEQALTAARDVAPHQARADEWRWSLTRGVAAARVLAGLASTSNAADEATGLEHGLTPMTEALRAAGSGQTVRFTDGLGHSRSVYGLVYLHLHLRALAEQGARWPATSMNSCRALAERSEALIEAVLAQAAPTAEEAGGDVALGLWAALCRTELAPALGKPAVDDTVIAAVEALLAGTASDALQPRTKDDAIDDWTYRELVALHALDRLAKLLQRDDWHQRVAAVAQFHEGHTQPDYITYQPWALAAFARHRETVMFAEQQFHDVTVHLSTAGPAGAVVPGLLLADAAATLRP